MKIKVYKLGNHKNHKIINRDIKFPRCNVCNRKFNFCSIIENNEYKEIHYTHRYSIKNLLIEKFKRCNNVLIKQLIIRRALLRHPG